MFTHMYMYARIYGIFYVNINISSLDYVYKNYKAYTDVELVLVKIG